MHVNTCLYLYIPGLSMYELIYMNFDSYIRVCAMYVHVCTWFILVHPGSNHKHANLFSPISTSLRYAI
jgi:hypothetical protein